MLSGGNNSESTNSKEEGKQTEEDLKLISDDLKLVEEKLKIQIGKKIGKGGFSTVYLTQTQDKRNLALKLIYIKPNSDDEISKNKLVNYSKNERILSMNLKNANCIKCINTYELKNSHILLLEFASKGDLANLTTSFYKKELFKLHPDFYSSCTWMNFMSESFIRFFFSQIVNSLDYLRKMNMVHKDLKLENLLICGYNNILKLSDFALANQVPFKGKCELSYVGTPSYMPPEILFKTQIEAKEIFKVDYYALGVILYKMLFGKFFISPNVVNNKRQIDRKKLVFELEEICNKNFEKVMGGKNKNERDRDKSPNSLIQLLKSLINKDITKRADLKDIKNNTWFTKEKEREKVRKTNEVNENDYLKFLLELQKNDFYKNNSCDKNNIEKNYSHFHFQLNSHLNFQDVNNNTQNVEQKIVIIKKKVKVIKKNSKNKNNHT